ncbi:TetR/AcrR family transcriptional regulator [Actinomadura kijaniata]|uniref:TetR/AcrR family transcriptional regulator n=1 Tax=Actinomadura kijaniata TaxID=46161 RepID=UPI00082BA911|nr:TetR/AcrR family transcriptional regulator [Actinomadura kijaniata]
MSTPRHRPRQQRSRFTFDAILDAAARLFERDGYAATTTNKVAELAGVSIGTLYHYVPNKDALLYALAERHIGAGMAALSEVFDGLRRTEPPLEDTVRTLVGAVAALHGAEPRMHRLLFDQAPRTPEGVGRLRALEESLAAEVEYHLRRLGVGGPDPGLTALLLVQAVEAQVHGAVLRPPAGRSTDTCVTAVTELWINALRTRPPA